MLYSSGIIIVQLYFTKIQVAQTDWICSKKKRLRREWKTVNQLLLRPAACTSQQMQSISPRTHFDKSNIPRILSSPSESEITYWYGWRYTLLLRENRQYSYIRQIDRSTAGRGAAAPVVGLAGRVPTRGAAAAERPPGHRGLVRSLRAPSRPGAGAEDLAGARPVSLHAPADRHCPTKQSRQRLENHIHHCPEVRRRSFFILYSLLPDFHKWFYVDVKTTSMQCMQREFVWYYTKMERETFSLEYFEFNLLLMYKCCPCYTRKKSVGLYETLDTLIIMI